MTRVLSSDLRVRPDGRLTHASAMQLGATPFLATHVNGDTAWVDVLFVPAAQRRRGLGRRIFEGWARQLPVGVARIQLFAMDLDGGSPIGFWDRLGFEPDGAVFSEVLDGSYLVKELAPAAMPVPSSRR